MNKKIHLLSHGNVILFAIFLLSLLFRYQHLNKIGWVDEKGKQYLGMRSTNHSIFHSSDAFSYERHAIDIISGRGFNLPFSPPMASIVLSVIFFINGHNYFGAKIFFAILGSLTSVLTYMVGVEIFGKKTAFLGSLFATLSFGLIMLCGALNIESLFSFLIMASLFLMIKTKRSGGTLLSFVSGCVIGITILTRTEFLLTFGFYLIWLFYVDKSDRLCRIKKILLLLLGVFLVVLPWSVRNYFYMSNYNRDFPNHNLPLFVPLTLNGPLNFGEGNNPQATGGYDLSFLGEELGHPKKYFVPINFDNPLHKKYVLHGHAEGIEFILKNPQRYLYLLKEKLVILKDSLAYGFGLNNYPGGLSGYRRSIADCFIPGIKLVLPNLILLLGGLFFALKQRDESILPAFFLVSIFCVNLLFYGLTRSGIVFLPIIFLYQSLFIDKILLCGSIGKKISLPFVGGILIMIIALWGYFETKEIIILEETYQKGSAEIKIRPILRFSK